MSVMSLPTIRLSIALICTALISTISPAAAQDQSPNDILEASRNAIQEIDGFSAQFRMKGEAGAMFKDTLPSMNGQLFFGTHDELGRVIHCIGEARDQQTKPSLGIDILIAPDRYLWTDMPTRTIHERPSAGTSRGLPTAIPLMLLKSMVQDDPFATDADNAETIDLLTQETINGTLCDVIHIKRTKPKGRTSRSGSDAYTDAKWYIGAEDKLPRKLEHITDAGLVKITLIFELSNLKVMSPTQDQLDVARPDGFTFKSTMPKPNTDQPTEPVIDDPIGEPIESILTPTERPAGPTTPRVKYAPAYSFTPENGSQITNTTQDGRITVLYFWGSWCIPCIETSPMVSKLAEELATEPVDIFALAIREADPDQTRDDFSAAGYRHTLVLDADSLVSSFKARVFPTLIIINRDGEIVFQRSITKDLAADDLVASAKEAIQEAI